FGQRGGDILCGDRAVEFTGLTSFGGEDKRNFLDEVGNALEFFVLGVAADLSLRLDLLHLLERAIGGEDGQSLRDEEVASVAIGNLLDVAGAAEFVNVLDK